MLALGLCAFWFSLLLPTSGCGSSSSSEDEATDTSPPSIGALKDSDDNALSSSGSEIDINSTILITFSEAMDESTLSASTVSLTDESGTAAAGTLSEASDTDGVLLNEFAFDPSAALKQLNSYTLTITGGSNGVQDASGNPLAADITYTFSTTCEIVDDFASDETIEPGTGCWTYSDEAEVDSTSRLNPYLAVSDGQLAFSVGAAESTGGIVLLTKEDSGDHTYTVEILSLDGANGTDERIGLMLFKSGLNPSVQSLFLTPGVATDTINVNSHNASADPTTILSEISDPSYPITLKMVKSGVTISTYYKQGDESNFTLLQDAEPFISDTYEVDLYFKKVGSAAFNATMDNFTRN